MDDVWTTRDLPVLAALVDYFDDPDATSLYPWQVAQRAGVDLATAERALHKLMVVAAPPYLTGVDVAETAVPQLIFGVTERAYRAVGAWPTADGLADRLEVAFRAAAAAEPDPERKRWYQTALGAFTGIGRAVTTDVLTQVVERQMGLG